MQIEFHSSPRPTLGIEVETCLVDAESRALSSIAGAVLAELGADHGGEHPKAKPELFDCTIEVITGICATVADARDDLAATITEVRQRARNRGAEVMCAGTHPFTDWAALQVTAKDRYERLVDSLGWPARRLAIYGIHYHVGVPEREVAIPVVNSLAYSLPLFLALSSSSPFWHGRDTGLASARTKIFEGLPTAGLPPQLSGWAEFEQYMDTLVSAGAIATIREVWWDVRPHPDFGTVELRMCDGMTNLDEICAVGALAQSLVAHLTARAQAGERLPGAREWVVRENKWLAARHGLAADMILDDAGTRRPIVDVIVDLVAELMPTAEALGCADELGAVLGIVERGTSSTRQRAVVANGGSLHDVVDLLVAEFDGATLR